MACNKDGEAVGELTSFEWVADQRTNPPQPHIIHTTTLDGIFELLFTAVSKGGTERIPKMIPTRVHKLWIAK